jgi:hypothetical protein
MADVHSHHVLATWADHLCEIASAGPSARRTSTAGEQRRDDGVSKFKPIGQTSTAPFPRVHNLAAHTTRVWTAAWRRFRSCTHSKLTRRQSRLAQKGDIQSRQTTSLGNSGLTAQLTNYRRLTIQSAVSKNDVSRRSRNAVSRPISSIAHAMQRSH